MNEAEALYDDPPQRLWTAENTEEYVLSVVLHNDRALAKAMSHLYSQRDFKNGRNKRAFAVIENRFDAGKHIDPVTIADTWIDMGIYEKAEADAIVGAWDGDGAEYENRIEYLAQQGGMRKARKDISKLWEASGKDNTPEDLAKMAIEFGVSWNSGSQKKYLKASEVKREEQGEKLNLGVPLLDTTVYENAGLARGTMKATLMREKHGKTRSACWEGAQHLRQGRTVMYITAEGQNIDIKGNFQQLLRSEFSDYHNNLLLKDSVVDIADIEAAIIEAVFADEVDVVIVDYLQLLEFNPGRWVGENEKYNEICKRLTRLAVKYDFLLNLLSQATTQEKSDRGWSNVPDVYDAYGSKQLIKDASMIMVGFRPGLYEELLDQDPFSGKLKVKDPDESLIPKTSVLMKAVRSRKKIDCLHEYVHFIDTDNGFQIHRQELI